MNYKIAFMAASIAGGLTLGLITPSASAAPIAWEATRGGDFGTVDLSTGVYTNLGNSGVQLTGMGVGTDGQLYSGLYRGSAFYKVNTQSGSVTTIGTSGLSFAGMGSTLTGVYGLGFDEYLYKIDITNGASTRLDFVGFAVTSLGMSTGSDILYLSNGSSLYNLSTSDGHKTLIGTATGTQYGGIVTLDGILWGGSKLPEKIYQINPTTAEATFQANQAGHALFGGLAPANLTTVPEPGTWALTVFGVGVLGASLRGQRRRSVLHARANG